MGIGVGNTLKRRDQAKRDLLSKWSSNITSEL